MSFMVSSGRSRIGGIGAIHAEARSKRRAHLTGAVDGLGNEAIGLVGPGFDDHVIGLGDGDLEFVGLDRLHVLPIGGDHRHREARNPDIEIGHGRAALMMRRRTRSPGANSPVQFAALSWPLTRNDRLRR
jgi:hypothetical protein